VCQIVFGIIASKFRRSQHGGARVILMQTELMHLRHWMRIVLYIIFFSLTNRLRMCMINIYIWLRLQ